MIVFLRLILATKILLVWTEGLIILVYTGGAGFKNIIDVDISAIDTTTPIGQQAYMTRD